MYNKYTQLKQFVKLFTNIKLESLAWIGVATQFRGT